MSYYELLDSPFTLWHHRHRALGALIGLLCTLVWPGVSLAQLDICGCIGHPKSLGAFDASKTATYPPGTTVLGSGVFTVTIPLPDDGVLIFSSFTIPGNYTVRFAHNAANTPVTLLVSGNVTLNPVSNFTPGVLNVSGDSGTSGSSGVNGVGGLGGPGGFPGGDGAYQLVNFANNGGTGVGPGGGSAGTASPLAAGSAGSFFGLPELLPLVGGSGGGGGASTSNALGCSGGGGGGGGGALLIAANGTVTVNGQIVADGGSGGGTINGNVNISCASIGGAGSGGAIRVVANTITGSGFLGARDGQSSTNHAGAIRLEAFTNTLSAGSTTPVAIRAPAPGPLTNPLTPTVEITQVGGQTVPIPPQGVFRGADVILPAPGLVSVRLATSGVPSGTKVNVTAKPRVGGAPILQSATLAPTNCTTAGDCDVTVTINLSAGAHVIEAQATFQP
jgi:hypothetical protein